MTFSIKVKGRGGASFDEVRSRIFKDHINACQLLEVHMVGTRFNWK